MNCVKPRLPVLYTDLLTIFMMKVGVGPDLVRYHIIDGLGTVWVPSNSPVIAPNSSGIPRYFACYGVGAAKVSKWELQQCSVCHVIAPLTDIGALQNSCGM